MDIELLFSRNPFVQQQSKQFSYIKPNLTRTIQLPSDKQQLSVALPSQFRNRNVLVELIGNGVSQTKAYYSNALAVRLSANYGQLRVAMAKTNRAVPKVYIKVYARMKNGSVRFYKDG